MAIVNNITANCESNQLSQQMISRQWDDKGTLIQFAGYPQPDNDEALIFRLIVWMKESEDAEPRELPPILLDADQWLVSNYYTQLVQTIKFQLCITNESGTFEKHSPIFAGHIGKSLSHNGQEGDIDVIPLFDPYMNYVDEKVNDLIVAAGDVQIDASLSTSGAAADAKATGDAIANVNGRLQQEEDKTGDLSDLQTEDKTDIVSAINEAVQKGGGNNSCIMEIEHGNYDTTNNRYNDAFTANVINRKPIKIFGAEKVSIKGLPASFIKCFVYMRGQAGNTIQTITAPLTDGKTADLSVPDGTYYIDFSSAAFDYDNYEIVVETIGGAAPPEQSKRIYSNAGRTTFVRFHIDKETNLTTKVVFRLPPNYSGDGTSVPLVIWFAGSAQFSSMNSDFIGRYSHGFDYLRDEGYAIAQIWSWGSEYDSAYAECGKDQPFQVNICNTAIGKGIDYLIDRYNIDKENVHVVALSVGGIYANWLVTNPIYPFKSISMFSPCLDFISMRGRYPGGRKAIAAALDLQGDIAEFVTCSYHYFSDEGKAFWMQNKEALILLNPAWSNLVGGTLEQNFDESFADAQAWWNGGDRSGIYAHTEYKRIGKVPVKIWGAANDTQTPYQIMPTTIKQLQNGGLYAEFHSFPDGDHEAGVGDSTSYVVPSITTQLGITYTNVGVGWVECVEWMRKNSMKYSSRTIPAVSTGQIDANVNPIMDGLMFWLDGLNVDSDSVWTDRIGNVNIGLTNCTKETVGVAFNGVSSIGKGPSGVAFDGGTIEVAYEMDTNVSQAYIINQPSSNVSMLRYENAIVITPAGGGGSVLKASKNSKFEVISALKGTNTVMKNGNVVYEGYGKNLQLDLNGTGKIAIGARLIGTNESAPKMWFKGRIISIRIYNRQLTTAEMKANQRADVMRYGLPLSM